MPAPTALELLDRARAGAPERDPAQPIEILRVRSGMTVAELEDARDLLDALLSEARQRALRRYMEDNDIQEDAP